VMYVIPSVLLGVGLRTHARGRLAAGHYWTDFDRPTPVGWRALSAPEAASGMIWLTITAVVVGIVVIFFARRAMVRWRRVRQARARGAE
jgi:hypothetical protein